MIEKLESLSLTKFVTPRELFKLVPNGNSIDLYYICPHCTQEKLGVGTIELGSTPVLLSGLEL